MSVEAPGYIQWSSWQFLRYAAPASLIGAAGGWAVAWGVSRVPGRLRHVAYAAVALFFAPTFVSALGPNNSLIVLFPFFLVPESVSDYYGEFGDTQWLRVRILDHILIRINEDHNGWGAISHIWPVVLRAPLVAMCAFVVMIYRYNRTSSIQAYAASPDTNDPIIGGAGGRSPLPESKPMPWAVLAFSSGLSLLLLIGLVDEAPRLFSYECVWDRWPEDCFWGAPGYAAPNQEWAPVLITLSVLYSTILVALWSGIVSMRQLAFLPRTTPYGVTRNNPARKEWLYGLVFAAILLAATVWAGTGALWMLAGAVVGILLAVLATRDSQERPVVLTVLAALLVGICSLVLYTSLWLPDGLDRGHILLIPNWVVGAWGAIMGFSSLRLSTHLRILLGMLIPAVIGGCALAIYISVEGSSGQAPYGYLIVGLIGVPYTLILVGAFRCLALAQCRYLQGPANRQWRRLVALALVSLALCPLVLGGNVGYGNGHLVFGAVVVLCSMAAVLFFCVDSDANQGVRAFLCICAGVFLVFMWGLSDPSLIGSLFTWSEVLPLGTLFESKWVFFAVRDALLACIIAYIGISGIRLCDPEDGEMRAWPALSNPLRCWRIAVGIVVTTACMSYVAVSLLQYAFAAQYGISYTDQHLLLELVQWFPGGRWGYWLRPFALVMELCVITAAGLYIYLRVQRSMAGQRW